MEDEKNKTKSLYKDIRQMYNEHPFPNVRQHPPSRSDERFEFIYDRFLEIDLANMANKIILDAGCGTGENTLAFRRIIPESTRVIGVDLSFNSIKIASSQQKSKQENIAFANESLLDLGIKSESIDLVICSGVLVAVPDPYAAYQELIRVLKPGGKIVLVLYHRYGRAAHAFRRGVVRLLAGDDVAKRAKIADKLFAPSINRLSKIGPTTYEATLYDQYALPCESRYSIGQILSWFKNTDITYLGTWPPVEYEKLSTAVEFSVNHPKLKKDFVINFLKSIKPKNPENSESTPGYINRALIEFLWMLDSLQLFSISGTKK